MKLNFKRLTETAVVPTRATDGSAGYDLYVDNKHTVLIEPHKTILMHTGIAMEIPKGYFGAIYPRSGISSNRGLRVANCVGVIDSDYRGNIGLPIHNDSDVVQKILPNERVAQIIFQKYEAFDLYEVEELTETDRGAGGFGSTGKK